MSMEEIAAAMEADRGLTQARAKYTVALISALRAYQGAPVTLVKMERRHFEETIFNAIFNYAYDLGEAHGTEDKS